MNFDLDSIVMMDSRKDIQGVSRSSGVVRCESSDLSKARSVWGDKSVSLMELNWSKSAPPFDPVMLKEVPRFYSLDQVIPLGESGNELKERLSELYLSEKGERDDIFYSAEVVNALVTDQVALIEWYREFYPNRDLIADIWSVAPSEERRPDSGDFVHLDGILNEKKLEPDSAILLRSYGDSFRYLRRENVDKVKFEAFFQKLINSMDGEEQVIRPEVVELQDPNSEAAFPFLMGERRFETIPKGSVALFRIGREHGLYHCAPWPSGWRFNFRLSLPTKEYLESL